MAVWVRKKIHKCTKISSNNNNNKLAVLTVSFSLFSFFEICQALKLKEEKSCEARTAQYRHTTWEHAYIYWESEHEYFLMFALVLQFPTICHIFLFLLLLSFHFVSYFEFKYDLLNRRRACLLAYNIKGERTCDKSDLKRGEKKEK